jgi:RNA polymerase sigma-70 factor (ECF subfamily)
MDLHSVDSTAVLGWLVAAALLRSARDPELAARLRRRDPGAMAELYDRYGRAVYSLVLRIVRDSGVAEDLVQEVFLRIWNRVQRFDDTKGALGTWILTIARNQAVDYVRSLEGRTWNSAATETEHLAASGSIETDYLLSAQSEQVRAAIAKLPDHQRRVIELAYFEGLSHSEMAEHIRQPLGTVKTWVRSALRILREELKAGVTA